MKNKCFYRWLCDALLCIEVMREVGMDTSIKSLREMLPRPPHQIAWWYLKKACPHPL